MDFLRKCATALDEGTPASEVLQSMRERYTTSGCLKVKTCLVRNMCVDSPDFTRALQDAMHTHSELSAKIEKAARADRRVTGDECVDVVLARLPPRKPDNVRALRPEMSEQRECKRSAFRARILKNMTCLQVDGRALLQEARQDIRNETVATLDLALSLMLLTGRRTCEMLNGVSTWSVVDGQVCAAEFAGQAKRKDAIPYRAPLLAPLCEVQRAITRLRQRQNHAALSNQPTSRRYQSGLSRRLAKRKGAFGSVGRVHALRGLYACMAWRLFDWGTASPAYVTMCILGHRGLGESLVYTTFDLGPTFHEEPTLGQGVLTCLSAFSSP